MYTKPGKIHVAVILFYGILLAHYRKHSNLARNLRNGHVDVKSDYLGM